MKGLNPLAAVTKVMTTVTTTATVSSVVTPTESTSTVDSMTTEVKSASAILETSDAPAPVIENRILPPVENEAPENQATLPAVDESVSESQSANSNGSADKMEDAG